MNKLKNGLLFTYFFISLLTFSAITVCVNAQDNNPDAMIAQRLRITIATLENAIDADCDPYGFHVAIKAAVRKDGEISKFDMDKAVMMAEINPFVARQKFDRFNFNMQHNEYCKDGLFIYSCGLVNRGDAIDIRDIDMYAEQYSFQIFKDGERFDVIVHADVSIIMTKPDDGSILGDVYYHNEDGGKVLWDKRTWLNKLPEVAYIRVGPGDDNANSRKGHDRYETLGAVSMPYEITISNYFTPGHYLPVIKFRKCTQDFTDYNSFKHLETIVKMTNLVSWSEFKENSSGKVIPKTTMKAERAKAPNFYSYFSTGNTVQGFIRDETGNPIQGKAIVVLEPDFNPNPGKKEVESLPGGKYQFEEVESGIYKVYVEGQENNFTRVEVCNCPQKGENPNHTYEVDLRLAVTYDVYVSATFPHLGSYEVVWRNVRIAFMDNEEDIPMYESDYFETGKTGFDDDDIEGLSGESVSQRIMPPYKVNYPGLGVYTMYSDAGREIPEAIRINFDEPTRVNRSEYAVNHFEVSRVPWEHSGIGVDLGVDFNYSVDKIQIMSGAGPNVFEIGTNFVWERLEDDIIEKLKRGEAATKNLSNYKGGRMTIRFSPNR